MLVYSNTFGAPFHFDDIPNIVENWSLRDSSAYWPPLTSRSLGYLSFALNFRFGGLDVFGYHLFNLSVHVCNALLAFWLTTITLRTPTVRRMETSPLLHRHLPLVAALLFAVHPLATQAVTYIVQRFTSLATLFYLLSLVLYVQARLSLDDRRWTVRFVSLYGLSLVAAAAAMRTKEIGITLPVVAAGYELLFFGQTKRTLLVGPLAATALLVPLGLGIQGSRLADALSDPSHFPAATPVIARSVYLLTQFRVVVTYLRLLVLPVGQNLDYEFALSYSVLEPGVVLALAFLLAVLALAVFVLVRARRTNDSRGVLMFFGIAWFFVTVSVESSVIPIRDVIFEHRVYLPSVGMAVVFGVALLCAIERARLRVSPTLQVAFALLITAGPLGAGTYMRNLVWKDGLSLWTDVTAKSPGKARPRNNLGVSYKESGRLDDAIREYKEAIRVEPDYPEAHNNLGAAYWAKGQVDDAIAAFREAIRLAPWYPDAHNNLGAAYGSKGLHDEAMQQWREAIRLKPTYPAAHNNLGVGYRDRGQLDEAMQQWREAIRLNGAYVRARLNLAAAYESRGQLDDAAREYREVIRQEPGNPKARAALVRLAIR